MVENTFIRALVLNDRMLTFDDVADIQALFEFYKDGNDGRISAKNAYCLLRKLGLKSANLEKAGLLGAFGSRLQRLAEEELFLLVAGILRQESDTVSAETAAEEDILMQNLKYRRLFHSIAYTTPKDSEQFVSEKDLEAFLHWNGKKVYSNRTILELGEKICSPEEIFAREDDNEVHINEEDFIKFMRNIPRKTQKQNDETKELNDS